jgi:hypothetical protein
VRRFVIVGGSVVLACAVSAASAAVWVDRALARVGPNSTLCLTAKDRQRVVTGNFPPDQQDVLIAKAINFDQGVAGVSWWQLRGLVIHRTYVTFWSPSSRTKEFSRTASRLKDCPARLGPHQR